MVSGAILSTVYKFQKPYFANVSHEQEVCLKHLKGFSMMM